MTTTWSDSQTNNYTFEIVFTDQLMVHKRGSRVLHRATGTITKTYPTDKPDVDSELVVYITKTQCGRFQNKLAILCNHVHDDMVWCKQCKEQE